MFPKTVLFATIVLALGGVACQKSQTDSPADDKLTHIKKDSLNISNNVLLKEWEGPYGGVPPLNKIKTEHFKPALEISMAEYLEEIDTIANNTEKPDFKNTIEALEKAGQTFRRVQTIYYIWGSTMSDSAFQQVEKTMEPVLAGFYDNITQNAGLFNRIKSIYQDHSFKTLNAEQQRLTWLYHTNFVRAGAKLDISNKSRVASINQQLAQLFTEFSQNLMADETNKFIVLETKQELDGMPQSFIDGAAIKASETNSGSDNYVISNTRSSIDPILTYAQNRDLREKAWKMFVNRGDNGDSNDNNQIITQILKLRKERAHLLGYKTHAHWRLENTMAKSPEKAMDLMMQVWKPAIARVDQEVKDMQLLADKEGKGISIEPWDYKFYAEKVRKDRYDLDQNIIKEYLQLEKLREGMFWVAEQLFDLHFTEDNSIPVYHPDVRVWEVSNSLTGKHVGYWYFDAFARDGKRSGAWMSAYRKQNNMDEEVTTIVSNNSNFIKGKPGEAVLISWDDATTLFHEFGHALHGLSSNVTYPSLSGTSVVRDYVEFPSQLLEHWLATPEVLEKFALHYKTGKSLPENLVQKIKKASAFNQGFATTEYLASGLIDMKLHLSEDTAINPEAFEMKTLSELNMPKELVMRHRTPQFAHIFSSDSYSAGYYSYLWSDVLTADAFTAFQEAKGPYDRKVAEKLRKNVFSAGNTIDPEVGYKNFRGRNPSVSALMKKRGFE
jgi:peptidyl-dipeptidase Dcp